jgi:hypothetical protein
METTTQKLRFLYRYTLQAANVPPANATPKQILHERQSAIYAPEFAQLTQAYEDCRYGDHSPDFDEIEQTEHLVRSIEKKTK